MEDHEMNKEAVHCHEFNTAGSFAELLTAISEWWAPKEDELGTVIEGIIFSVDEDGFSCQVFWCSLPPGVDIVKTLEEKVAKEKANPFELPILGPPKGGELRNL